MWITDPTHSLSVSNASRMGRLNSSRFFPSVPRWRTLHASTQSNASSLYIVFFIVECYSCVNPRPIVTEWQGRYSDCHQEETDGAKDGLGYWDSRGLLRRIHDFDGRIHLWDSIILPSELSAYQHLNRSKTTLGRYIVAKKGTYLGIMR